MLSRTLIVWAVLFCPAFVVEAASSDYLYWSQAGGVFRGQPNGSNVEPVAAGFEVRGLALDQSRTLLLWSEVEPRVPIVPTGAIRSATLEGGNVQDAVRNLPRPSGVAFDPDAGRLYWSDLELQQIKRGALNGATPTETIIGPLPSVSVIHDITIDVPQDRLYFGYVNPLIDGLFPGAIARARLDGSELETIVAGLTEPWGVALDSAAGKLYWTDDHVQSGGLIRRANLDGSQPEDVVTGLKSPRGIALDVGAGHIYWADTGAGTIQRADLDGQHVVDVLTGLDRPEAIALSIVPEPSSISLACVMLGALVCVRRSCRAPVGARRI
jgi:low density lipoprotein receptor-related protein 5/6